MALQTARNPTLPARGNPPPPLSIRRAAHEWKMFEENYTFVAKLPSQTDDCQRVLSLHTIRPEALILHNGMPFSDTHTLKDIL